MDACTNSNSTASTVDQTNYIHVHSRVCVCNVTSVRLIKTTDVLVSFTVPTASFLLKVFALATYIYVAWIFTKMMLIICSKLDPENKKYKCDFIRITKSLNRKLKRLKGK